jgi:hypothetical protein
LPSCGEVIVQLAIETAAPVLSSGVYRLTVSELGFSLCTTSPSEIWTTR